MSATVGISERHARSLLFVPATKPERFVKALDSGADCIIIDLEDTVAEGSKDSAREQLAQHLPRMTRAQLERTVVRVNTVGTLWHEADIALLRDWTPQGVAVMLPKAEDAGALRGLAKTLGDAARIVALIESLAGLDAADALTREPQVVRLAFGHLDFQLDLGMRATAEEPELAFARTALVAASRRARLPAPIDGVTTETSNAERLAADARRARVRLRGQAVHTPGPGCRGEPCLRPYRGRAGLGAPRARRSRQARWRSLQSGRPHGRYPRDPRGRGDCRKRRKITATGALSMGS
jgi:citrate lyase subunit beta/citryl-CoA lyase